MPYRDSIAAKRRRQEYRDRNKEFIESYLKENPCVQCGFSDIRALDFDHIDPNNKYRSISKLKSGTPSLSKLQEEVEKCQVLCANCHRIKTHENGEFLNHRNTHRS